MADTSLRDFSKNPIESIQDDNQIIKFDPLYHEINLLRIEGYYFCFDPKASKKPDSEYTYDERLRTPDGYIEKKFKQHLHLNHCLKFD